MAWAKNLPLDIPVYMRAEADGYAVGGAGALSKETLLGDAPLEMRLRPGREVRLRMVEADGRPAAKTGLRIESSEPGSSRESPYPGWNYGGLSTDAEGLVVIKYLRRDAGYRLRASRPEAGDFIFSLNDSGDAQIVTLAPERMVDVRMIHFPKAYRDKQIRLQVSGASGRGGQEARFHAVKIDANGEGSLRLKGRGTGAVEIVFQDPRLQPLGVRFASWEAAGASLVFDYAQLPAEARAAQMRRVQIRFMQGDDEVFPGGRFYIHRLAEPHFWDADGFALKAGERLFAEWADSTKLKLTDGWGMIGAVVDVNEEANQEIVVDADLTEIVVPVRPAGMVRAKVVDASGRSVSGARVFGSTDHESHEKRRTVIFPDQQSSSEWRVSGPVEFSFWGIPLWAADGLVFARGPKVSVSARRPVAEAVVKLPEVRSYSVRFTDQAGRALAGIGCRLSARFRDARAVNPPLGLVERTSDSEGRVRFEAGVDFGGWDGLELKIDASAPGFARTAASIAADKVAKDPVIELAPAAEFRLRFLNRATGQGVPGIEVTWREPQVQWIFQTAGAVSDADGWVVFRDMAAGRKFRLEYRWSGPSRLQFVDDAGARVSGPWSELTVADSGMVVEMEPR